MANRWKGNIIAAAATTSSGTDYTGKANGAWGLNSQLQQKQANLWAKGVGAPTAPTIGTATAGNTNASVAFTASSDAGAPGSLTYTATSTPGSFTNTGSSSPIVVSGLTNGTQYTFKVNATNSLGYVSPDSAASNSTGTTVPGAPTIGTATATNASASITFTAPANTGGLPITGYTATSSPGSITGTAASSPVTVSGLTIGTSYTFTVVATNALGSGASSAASNSVIPLATTLFFGGNTDPYIYAYPFSGGFGTKTANPSSPPIGSVTNNGLKVSSGNIVFLSLSSTPFIGAHAYTGSGWGTKYANPGSLPPAASSGVTISADGSLVAVSSATSPYVSLYPFSTGFGTKAANPSTLPGATALGVGMTSTGSAIIVGTATSPNLDAYPLSGSTFGTRYSNPATLPGFTIRCVNFNPSNNTVAVSGNLAYPYVYAWSAGFGTKFADPTTPPADSSINSTVSFNRAGNVLAFSGNAPKLYAYAWSNGFGTAFSAPSTAPTGNPTSIAFNPNDSALSAAFSTGKVWNWSNSTGFGTTFADPVTLPDAIITGTSFTVL